MDRRTACGPLVGGIHCTAAAFWDTASAVPLLDIQLSPLALDGIQKNLLEVVIMSSAPNRKGHVGLLPVSYYLADTVEERVGKQ